jgi:hypothetical protein
LYYALMFREVGAAIGLYTDTIMQEAGQNFNCYTTQDAEYEWISTLRDVQVGLFERFGWMYEAKVDRSPSRYNVVLNQCPASRVPPRYVTSSRVYNPSGFNAIMPGLSNTRTVVDWTGAGSFIGLGYVATQAVEELDMEGVSRWSRWTEVARETWRRLTSAPGSSGVTQGVVLLGIDAVREAWYVCAALFPRLRAGIENRGYNTRNPATFTATNIAAIAPMYSWDVTNSRSYPFVMTYVSGNMGDAHEPGPGRFLTAVTVYDDGQDMVKYTFAQEDQYSASAVRAVLGSFLGYGAKPSTTD